MVENTLKAAADTTSKFGCAGRKKAAEDESGCKKVEATPLEFAGCKKAAEDDAATSKSGCKKVEAAPSKKQGRKAAATEHQVIAEPVVAEKQGREEIEEANELCGMNYFLLLLVGYF